jgi:hypothetical protein
MKITTRAELDEALRRVLVDAIADEEETDTAGTADLVTVARSDVAVAPLPSLRPPRSDRSASRAIGRRAGGR